MTSFVNRPPNSRAIKPCAISWNHVARLTPELAQSRLLGDVDQTILASRFAAAKAFIGRTESELLGRRVGEHFRPHYPKVLQGEVVVEHRRRGGAGKGSTFMEIRGPLIEQGGKVRILGMSIPAFPATLSDSPKSGYHSPAMQETIALALLVAGSDSSVLLTGESGSGKDFLASFIHDHSGRAGGPFESINCATIPHDLAESELFGHEKGAFSGAGNQKKGLIELSDGGTLLLNEIGEMPPPLQAKLLTFLDSSSFRRIGGVELIRVNTRILAATNRDLKEMIATNQFRLDLLHRLNVFTIQIPPLRERIEEIPALVVNISQNLATKMNLPSVPVIRAAAMKKLQAHPWSGNVRELKNVLERAFVLARGGTVEAKSIVFDADSRSVTRDGREAISSFARRDVAGAENAEASRLKAGTPCLRPEKQELHRLHEEYLVEKGWTRARLAELLGVDSSTLKKWLKKAGIEGGHAGRPRKRRAD
jgi:DNA-binding NtrC family response regulator